MGLQLKSRGHSRVVLSSLLALFALALLLLLVFNSLVFPPWFATLALLKMSVNFILQIFHEIIGTVYFFINYINLYIPLATLGAFRWAIWIFKRICAYIYEPFDALIPQYYSTLSIVTTVYNEKPHLFARALSSWQSNNPDELIAVIDYTDTDCIKIFKEFSDNKPWAKLIVMSKPGKRISLSEGILTAKSDIVALVDSDTIWAPNIKDILLAPFRDPKIGGVTARNHVIIDDTKYPCIWQRITEIFWSMRNYLDLPSQTAMGGTLSCLTGRSSLYRRKIIVPKLDELLNEVILGKRKESGEDKCLTRLIQREGWKTFYQSNAEVYSSAATDFKGFWSQRLRWTRNSHNSDLVSLWDGWVWKHPYLTFYMIDRLISSFTLFLGPIYFAISIYMNQWIIALSILIWWMIGRAIKLIPHLRRKPEDILILPLYVAINFLNALIKVYGLVTITDQKQIREVKVISTTKSTQRNRKKLFFKKITDVSLTTGIIMGLVILVSEFGK